MYLYIYIYVYICSFPYPATLEYARAQSRGNQGDKNPGLDA